MAGDSDSEAEAVNVTYDTSNKGAIVGWGAVALAAGGLVSSILAAVGVPAEVVGTAGAFVAVVLPPFIGLFRPNA